MLGYVQGQAGETTCAQCHATRRVERPPGQRARGS
jgi:hypothetical protein